MRIRAVKLRIVTAQGEFGFIVRFSRNLTIIRGSNSSGKSTLFNSILYGLGMEELLGGRGEAVLPYAVKEWFYYEDKKIPVVASEVYLEAESSREEIVTFRRAIRDESRSSKLVEIIAGPHITAASPVRVIKSTYLFDPGAALQAEGFHHYLEGFMGMKLPLVPTTTGGETKLYLQTVFAALAVEQKRGWSDYIGNIPFFGIRDTRTRIAEFLLGLTVFELNALRNRLNTEAVQIANGWESARREIQRLLSEVGIVALGIPEKVNASFDASLVRLRKRVGAEDVEIGIYAEQLRSEHAELERRASLSQAVTSAEVRAELDGAMAELQRLTHLYESIAGKQVFQKASLGEYQQLLLEAKEDLARNKAAEKLRTLGSKNDVTVASNLCPTCHQPVEDTLLQGIVTGPQMDLATNIEYLDRQRLMLEGQIAGGSFEVSQNDASLRDLAARMAAKRDELNAIRADASSGALQSRSNLKRQLQIEAELQSLERTETVFAKSLELLVEHARQLAANQSARKTLPRTTYTEADESKIELFEKLFRANISAFDYGSADVREIEINRDTLTPFLAHMELRQLNRTDIRTDSSASDFVRLIWGYLLGLYQASSHMAGGGNHPGLLLFDEPGQHSMAEESQHALFQLLGSEKGLQSVVAASFDESEAVFRKATAGVKFELVQWDGKSIGPLQ